MLPQSKAAESVVKPRPVSLPLLEKTIEQLSRLTSLSDLILVTSCNALLGRASEKAFNECLGVSNAFSSSAKVQLLVTYHHAVAIIPLGEVTRESCSVSS